MITIRGILAAFATWQLLLRWSKWPSFAQVAEDDSVSYQPPAQEFKIFTVCREAAAQVIQHVSWGNLRLGWLIAGMFFIFIVPRLALCCSKFECCRMLSVLQKLLEDILVIPLSIFDLGDHIFFKARFAKRPHVGRKLQRMWWDTQVFHSFSTEWPPYQVQQVVSWLFWLFDVFVSFISGYDKTLGKGLDGHKARPLNGWC